LLYFCCIFVVFLLYFCCIFVVFLLYFYFFFSPLLFGKRHRPTPTSGVQKGRPVKLLLGTRNAGYPAVHDEMRKVQEEILKKYSCEQLLAQTVGVGGLSASSDAHHNSGLRLRVLRGRSGALECTWECAWSSSLNSRVSSSSASSSASSSSSASAFGTSSFSSTTTFPGDLSQLQAALALSETVLGGEGEERLLLTAAGFIYALRRHLRDGNEHGIHGVLHEAARFETSTVATIATGVTKGQWWLKCAGIGFLFLFFSPLEKELCIFLERLLCLKLWLIHLFFCLLAPCSCPPTATAAMALPLWWSAMQQEFHAIRTGFDSVRVSRELCAGKGPEFNRSINRGSLF
jgi:hypothetical protein